MIKIWESELDKIDEESKILPLLLTIIKNKSLDYLRHQEIKLKTSEDMKDWQEYDLKIRISSLSACNPSSLFTEEIKTIINQTQKSFSKTTRRVFRESRINNKSNKEIAEELNISIKDVEYHISKALKILRKNLSDYL